MKVKRLKTPKNMPLLIVGLFVALCLIGAGIWELGNYMDTRRAQHAEAALLKKQAEGIEEIRVKNIAVASEAEAKLKEPGISDADTYNYAYKLAMLYAGQNNPQAKTYAQKALDVQGKLGKASAGPSENPATIMLQSIVDGTFNAAQ